MKTGACCGSAAAKKAAWRRELKPALWLSAILAFVLWAPVEEPDFQNAVLCSVENLSWYAHRYAFATLLPVFLLAGLVVAFFDKELIRKALGADARKVIAYSVAAVGGSIASVCSCAVLPIFAGIKRMGAGIGPACTFLFAGPAINVLAIVFTAQLVGVQLALARLVAAIVGSVAIGLAMAFVFRRDAPSATSAVQVACEATPETRRQRRAAVVMFVLMIVLSAFLNWARSGDVRAMVLCCPGGMSTYGIEGEIVDEYDGYIVIRDTQGKEVELAPEEVVSVTENSETSLQNTVYRWRWAAVLMCAMAIIVVMVRRFDRSDVSKWGAESWQLAKRLLVPLALGVLLAGFLLGTPYASGYIPAQHIEMLVGPSPDMLVETFELQPGMLVTLLENLWPALSCFFASLTACCMYFATLTEVPIVAGLLRSGMGDGPALALLLAGPAVSIPNLLVIGTIMGIKRTAVYLVLVLFVASVSGLIYGWL